MNCRLAPTGQHPQSYLYHTNHGQHQKQAPHHRTNGGSQHPEPQNLQIDVGFEHFIHILTVEQIDGQFQALRNQRREEEEAEGDNLENKEFLDYVEAGVAGRWVFEAVLPRSREGEAHKDRDGEERVDINKPVESSDMDAGGGYAGAGGGSSVRSVVPEHRKNNNVSKSWLMCFLHCEIDCGKGVLLRHNLMLSEN
ncbi:hypothetical protein F511_32597 [Dorcoceras hygrometricum]|uniref:Uncharacterized protein n=1 Tax=Dorcoceras hygrometricum TaxID=472368 RepID=A0A2Z7CYP1_9LAMI|nr:hypothetical protein F511_32597 [Dorcoceras hygrometricum]